ncbi:MULTISPECIES: methylenetetrahydrofolate reductase [NAD(P)H] [Megasphaera]|jgi:hypothetical protein|uniref:Methylenetetrahydrofolate reductase n=1 Tax=Megasphaera hutchinsoni TaxID=1588748 RepID=A0A134CDD3_9FIRM|nr:MULTISPECIES: methylenetetrahydrofolate reductase [NAD(P)H] [Megasphaera]EGS36897.1 methylenetetrahydrofolate reductase (NAD(P)H) [Megasphaera sp. UPII 135-E]KXB90241.1 methylenetetrahydrofolate reductase [Megasphaera hutchinsoni]MUP59801.1 methylenetetrahydrofolate reductase [NAD(P)H] [Veillonellaceae bacterium M2-4]
MSVKNKTTFSLEVFPPKKEMPLASVYPTLTELSVLHPDFISVTCGAQGTGSNRTAEIAATIKEQFNLEPVAHLPGIYLTKEEVCNTLKELKKHRIHKILALRGDMTPEKEPAHDFAHASDLIRFIKKESPDFHIIGACYPEGHVESKRPALDIIHLKEKVDAGASSLISQLFFDNTLFYRFLERCEIASIHVPIAAGIMPVTNKKQIERMVSLCGATLPLHYQHLIAKYGDNPVAMRDAGIAYAIAQIIDLLAHGVDGIHVYTMNNAYIAQKIADAIRTLL